MGLEVTIRPNNLTELNDAAREAVKRAVTIIGMKAEANAVKEVDRAVYNTPETPRYRRTGNLRQFIHYDKEGDDTVLLIDDIDYAAYVEFGTSKMAARPFIKPAVLNYLEEYREILEDCLKNG